MPKQVWLECEDDDAWALCDVLDEEGDEVKLKRQTSPVGVSPLVTVTKAEFEKMMAGVGDLSQPVVDLCQLEDVHYGSMLHTLRQRYEEEDIYTAIGPVVIAINPYKKVESCSAEAFTTMKDLSEENLPPHVFRSGLSAYHGMLSEGTAQSILISGESGAGKTETTKLCMNVLAEVSASSGSFTEMVLESGVVLEAFGNAKTVYNNNSSRFGKWCCIHFDPKGKMSACTIKSYLLEQSRVVGVGEGTERCYHIYYHMLAGANADEKKAYRLLGDNSAYKYTEGQGTSPGIDDAEEWQNVHDKLEVLNFSSEQQQSMFSLFAAVLALGNVEFEEAPGDASQVKDMKAVEIVAELLQVDAHMLAKKVTTRTVVGRSSSYVVPLLPAQAYDARDALSKAIYSNVFDWLIANLNSAMAGSGKPIDEDDENFVGLLDVFGFENFAFNSFEQLCINFTNEKLQNHFMDALVVLRQKEYASEGIECKHITFPDNLKQIELIEAKGGLLLTLDEEGALPKGSDEGYVEKLHAAFDKNELYSKPKRGGKGRSASDAEFDKLQFIMTHYAGEVRYTALNWLDKNRGFVNPEITVCMCSSKSELLVELFTVKEDAPASPAGKSPGLRTKGGRGGGSKKPTVGSKFRASLKALSTTLLQTSARYIRCVKPNAAKKAGIFDGQFCQRQLAYTGVSAVVTIQRSGYPVTLLMTDFVKRFRCTCFDSPKLIARSLEAIEVCKNVLTHLEKQAGAKWFADKLVQLGKTKIFMKEGVMRVVDKAREKVWVRAGIKLQKSARRRLAQRVAKLVKAHTAKAKELRAAIDQKEVEAAGNYLDALSNCWTETSPKPSSSRYLEPLSRQLGEFELEVQALEEALDAEKAALEQMSAALAKTKDGTSDKDAYLALKMALLVGKEATAGILPELTKSITDAEKALDAITAKMNKASKDFKEPTAEELAEMAADQKEAAAANKPVCDEVAQWEAEAQAAADKREEERREKAEEFESSVATDKDFELVTLKVPCEADPEIGTGVQFNEMNTVVAVLKEGDRAAKDVLHVGDVVISLGGEKLKGAKVSAMMNECAVYELVVARQKMMGAEKMNADGLPEGDFSGWLQWVKARDGKALARPKKCWCVLQEGQFTWYLEEKRGKRVPHSQSLKGASLAKPVMLDKLGGGKAKAGADSRGSTAASKGSKQPAVFQQFIEKRQFPFKIKWDGQVDFEIVCAATTGGDRTEWMKALTLAIKRVNIGAPTSGWLMKQGGRKTGRGAGGWKKRWFVLTPAAESGDFKYHESPQSAGKREKGAIALNKGAQVFITDKTKKPHCFCITSQGEKDARPITTVLSAGGAMDLKKWIKSVQDVIIAAGGDNKIGGATLDGKAPKLARGASGTGVGRDANLEKLASLDAEAMRTLRMKQLEAICNYMDIMVPESADRRKELKEQGCTKKEIEEDIKENLTQLVQNKRNMIQQSREARKYGAY